MRCVILGVLSGLLLILGLPVQPRLAVVLPICLPMLIWGSRRMRLIITGALLGIGCATWTVQLELSRQLNEALAGRDLQVSGTVVGIPEFAAQRTVFRLAVESVVVPSGASFKAKQLQLSWYGPTQQVFAGERWRFTVRLKPPRGLGNPGGFDFARWMFQQRIHARGYVREVPPPARVSVHPWQRDAVRARLGRKLESLDSANSQVALVQALSIGLTHGVDDATWTLLRDSGIAHLLAISGLHIGLIAAWAYAFGVFLWRCSARLQRRSSQQSFALCCSAVAALAYATLAGFTLPTQRALLMLLSAALLTIRRRPSTPGTVLLVALSLVLAHDSLAIMSAGFWLSFGTVAILFYLHHGYLTRHNRLTRAAATHLKLGVLLLPATAWFFQTGSLVAPLANAIAVPMVGLIIVPLSLLSVLLMFWESAASLCLGLAEWLLSQLLVIIGSFSRYNWASISLSLPSVEYLIMASCGLLVLFAPRGLRLKWLSVPLLMPAILINALGSRVDGFELHMLDVGQGLAAVILTEQHVVLFDTGRGSRRKSLVESVILPFLRTRGRHRPDIVVVSHLDSDHAGGVADLQRHFPDIQFFSSDLAHPSLNSADICEAGYAWDLDGVSFSFLHPAAIDLGSRNNRSCVLLVHYGASRVLLTGDIEASAEVVLVDRMGQLPVTVMSAPHHGSRTSSTAAFVNSLQPEHVVFSAGYNNTFGFPHDEVQMRYKLVGSQLHTTGQDGAVSFEFDKSGLRKPPIAYWQTHRRFWRRYQ